MAETWLTIRAAAARLGVAQPTVRVWCRQGRFPHAIREETPRGPVWRIPERDVAQLVRPPMGRPRKDRADASVPHHDQLK